MKIKEYIPEMFKYSQSRIPSLTINKSGSFRLNTALMNLLEIVHASYVRFAQSEDNQTEWYIGKALSGFQVSGNSDEVHDRSVRFTSKALLAVLTETFDTPLTWRLTVHNQAVNIEGSDIKWYKIKTDLLTPAENRTINSD